MILVDSSVWIEHFRGTQSPEAQRLVSALQEDADLCTCGLILTELLQGAGQDREFKRIHRALSSLIYLPLERSAYILAANLFREARTRGKTIRNSTDCIIAACAITHRVPLLHRDRDFQALAAVSTLKLY